MIDLRKTNIAFWTVTWNDKGQNPDRRFHLCQREWSTICNAKVQSQMATRSPEILEAEGRKYPICAECLRLMVSWDLKIEHYNKAARLSPGFRPSQMEMATE